MSAVTSKNVDWLRQLLSQGVDPCFVDQEGRSPVHIVCGKSSCPDVRAMLELLVYFGARLDVADRFGFLPIHTAAGVSADHVQLLLDAGSPIDSQDNAGRTPLMLACQGECPEALTIVQYLLDRNAKVSMTDREGFTALHSLCHNGQQESTVRHEIAYKLLYAGLSADCVDNGGRMAVCHEIEWILIKKNDKILPTHVLSLLIQSGSKLDVYNKVHERAVKNLYFERQYDLISNLLDIAEPSLSLRTLKALNKFCKEMPNSLDVNDAYKIKKRLQDLSRIVQPLKRLCCQNVRDLLGGQVLKKAELLPIPRSLQKDLLLKA